MSDGIKVDADEVYRREEMLRWFKSVMMSKLLENAHKGNKGLNNVDYLLKCLDQEVAELKDAIRNGSHRDIIRESGDVSNFSMFIGAYYRSKSR